MEKVFDNKCIEQIQEGWGNYLVVFPEERFNNDYKFGFWYSEFNDALEAALKHGRDFFIYKHEYPTTLFTDKLFKTSCAYIEYRNGEIYDYWMRDMKSKQHEQNMLEREKQK